MDTELIPDQPFLNGELIEIEEPSWLFDKLIGDPLDYGRVGDWQDIEAASTLGFLEDNEDASKYHELAMYDALKNHPWTKNNRFIGGILGLASAPAQLAYDVDQGQNPWPQLLNRSKGAFKYMMSPVMESMRLEPEILKAGQDVNRYNVHNQLLNQRPSTPSNFRKMGISPTTFRDYSNAMDRAESRVSPAGDVMAYGLKRGGIASL